MSDHSKTESLRGGEAREDHDREFEAAPDDLKANGQHADYWVLSKEERAKGFVRPVRRSYKHVGDRPAHPTRPLTDEERERHEGRGYVLFEPYPEGYSPSTGRFWTHEQLASTGCGGVTTMAVALAETYARNPSFYGETMCVGCGEHRPVAEFLWDGTQDRVGA